MPIGQAYSDILIDSRFDELESIKEPKDIADTILGIHLPESYLYRYTPKKRRPRNRTLIMGFIAVLWCQITLDIF